MGLMQDGGGMLPGSTRDEDRWDSPIELGDISILLPPLVPSPLIPFETKLYSRKSSHYRDYSRCNNSFPQDMVKLLKVQDANGKLV